jgi:cytoskeletal protein CcmA (bactofilin family)
MTENKPQTLQSQLVTVARLESVGTFIAERTTFKGDFLADEDQDAGIKIDGKLEGSITIPKGGVVHIGPTGNVAGASIEADYVYIEGFCDSKIIGRLGVEVTGSATVRGSIEYLGSYNQHNGAKVRASIAYNGADES